jgi:hypothetical protein
MTQTCFPDVSNRDLIARTIEAARSERTSTATLIALLTELDARRLYLSEGCSSLFTYCTQVLHLSEHAAYHRIEAARAARKFPIILELLADGAITLTTIALLRPHLTVDNHRTLLESARYRSKRDVECLLAALAPRPDVKPLILRVARGETNAAPDILQGAAPDEGGPGQCGSTAVPRERLVGDIVPPAARPRVTPLAPDRYLLKVTLSGDAHAKLRRAQDLLRHAVPNGDPAVVLERALTLLVGHLERAKFAAAVRPRPLSRRPRPSSRRIPATVKRAVWARDQGRCAFVGALGRCAETGRLEFHHVIPFAAGGAPTVENLSLRCGAHHGYESELRFGKWGQRRREGHALRIDTHTTPT